MVVCVEFMWRVCVVWGSVGQQKNHIASDVVFLVESGAGGLATIRLSRINC